MLIRAGSLELEIREDAFVCLEEGEISHFCEWSRLDPKLQESFKGLKKEISDVMENFLRSEKSRAFLALSETYESDPEPGCAEKKTDRQL